MPYSMVGQKCCMSCPTPWWGSSIMATVRFEVRSVFSFRYSECCVCLSVIFGVPNEILLPLCRHRNSRLFVPAFRDSDTPDTCTHVRKVAYSLVYLHRCTRLGGFMVPHYASFYTFHYPVPGIAAFKV
jgi:hypothetical protein